MCTWVKNGYSHSLVEEGGRGGEKFFNINTEIHKNYCLLLNKKGFFQSFANYLLQLLSLIRRRDMHNKKGQEKGV